MVETKPLTCRKEGRHWVIHVAPGAIASVGFTTPFRNFEAACVYMAFWSERLRERLDRT